MIQPGLNELDGSCIPIDAHWTSLVRVTKALIMLLLAACSQNRIVRVREGHAYQERAIDTTAYTAYVRARLYELKGDTDGAITQYRYVLSRDPQAVEAHVRLGALFCTTAPTEAFALWERAERLDAEDPKLWLERARCEFTRGNLESALRDATWATRFEPQSQDAIFLIVAISSKLGRPEVGLRWLHGALASNPMNARLWRLMLQNASTPKPERLYAAAQLSQLRPPDASEVPNVFRARKGSESIESEAGAIMLPLAMDEAFRKADLTGARRIATLLGLNPEKLALSAAASGAFDVALAQAELLLALDPNNASVWVVGILAADAVHDEARFFRLLSRPPHGALPLECPLRGPIIELLRRRVAFDLGQVSGETASKLSSRNEETNAWQSRLE